MLTLRKNNEEYIIECFTEKGKPLTYRFGHDQLSEKSISHLRQLQVFKNSRDTTFPLNEKQNKAFSEVLIKLQQERNSGYIFSLQLQRTYLFELIHLITKLQLSSLPLFE